MSGFLPCFRKPVTLDMQCGRCEKAVQVDGNTFRNALGKLTVKWRGFRRAPIFTLRKRWRKIQEKRSQNRLERAADQIVGAIEKRDYDRAVKLYRSLIREETAADQIYAVAPRWMKDAGLTEAFHRACVDSLKYPELREMIYSVANGDKLYRPSQFWQFFATYHALQLDIWTVENFKRTVNNGYYQWSREVAFITQTIAIEKLLSSPAPELSTGEKPEKFSKKKWRLYLQFLAALFQYARETDTHGLCDKVTESEFGNPIGASLNGRLVTQDLCNSIIEVNTILDAASLDTSKPFRVMELGAGHGRVMFTILKAFPHAQIAIVDIPPALFVSQWYLTNTFPGLKAFKWRAFRNYEDIKSEFEGASIAFLSPEQIELIPDKCADLFVNISSLHEMMMPQIQNWFSHIDRVCRGYFYTKQIKEYPNLIDNITVRESDYPVNPRWQETLKRTNPIFPIFFEGVYRIP